MVKILIVGAGPSGLCAAKTFLQRDPDTKLLIVDSRGSIGGVWSQEQLYPTLKTNNLFSTIDFSDFPMEASRFGVGPGEHVSGEAMHGYLCAYADHFKLTDKIRLNTRVLDIRRRDTTEEDDKGWDVTVDNGEIIHCEKLVIATGVLSSPHLPQIDGASDFNAPFIHSSSLGRDADRILSDPSIKTIAVLGGSKSAYDAVHMAISTGHQVEWIIRKSGRGPVYVFPPHTMLGPFKALREKLTTRRFFSFMSPCSFPDYSGFGWLRRFLHGNPIGKAIARGFWTKIRASTVKDCRYRQDKAFNVLEPEQNLFWYGTATGVFNYETDILAHIKTGDVRVHRADISHLSSRTIHLSSSSSSPTTLPVDALVACTGYSARPSLTFSPSTIHSHLGIPSTSHTPSQRDFWTNLDSLADASLSSEFPRLVNGPFESPSSRTPKPFHPGATGAAEAPYSPWRLYRGIAPPGLTAEGDRSLVFVSMASGVANTVRTELQCLWALAYFEGRIPDLPTRKGEEGGGAEENAGEEGDGGGKVWIDTARFQRWASHRAPYRHGRFYPDLVMDQVPYWDMLMRDLGLENRRKGGGWRELFAPYGAADYKGVVEEWIARNGGRAG